MWIKGHGWIVTPWSLDCLFGLRVDFYISLSQSAFNSCHLCFPRFCCLLICSCAVTTNCIIYREVLLPRKFLWNSCFNIESGSFTTVVCQKNRLSCLEFVYLHRCVYFSTPWNWAASMIKIINWEALMYICMKLSVFFFYCWFWEKVGD